MPSCCRQVQLNGKRLQLVDDTTLPVFKPKVQPGSQPVSVPPLSFGFIVVPGAKAPACAA